MGPFGMALSRQKKVPRLVPQGRGMEPCPPPFLWTRHCTSDNIIKKIPILCVPEPFCLMPLGTVNFMHQRRTNRLDAQATSRQITFRYGAHTNLRCTPPRACFLLGKFIPQWACIWPAHQHCCAFLDSMCRPFNLVTSASPLGILFLRCSEEFG